MSTKIVTLKLTLKTTLTSNVSTAEEATSPVVGQALADALTSGGYTFHMDAHHGQHWTITRVDVIRACHG